MSSQPDNLSRIKRLGGILKIVSIIGIFTIPWVKPLAWMFYNQLPIFLRADFGKAAPVFLPLSSKILGICISLPSSAIIFLMILNMTKLFSLYAHGKVLEQENAVCIRNTGLFLMVSTFYTIIIDNPLRTVALTLMNGPGHRSLSFGFGSGDFIALFVAGFLFITAFVAAEAHRINKDAELTI
jgi:hypothetical protein